MATQTMDRIGRVHKDVYIVYNKMMEKKSKSSAFQPVKHETQIGCDAQYSGPQVLLRSVSTVGNPEKYGERSSVESSGSRAALSFACLLAKPSD